VVNAAWVALSVQQHIGAKTLQALLTRFGSAQAVLAADEASLRQVPGIGPKIAATIQQINLEAFRRALDTWQRAGVRIIPWDDPLYPHQLQILNDPPPVLFIRGQWPLPAHITAGRLPVGIVGTRQPSPAAHDAAYDLGAQLAANGHAVVSGLAYGIDAAAHHGALSTTGGITLAVLGSGVLRPYPAAHHALAEQIMTHGALIAECAPDANANAPRLVARNRLIAGLVGALFVMETDENGGAMYAARWATDCGTAVYTLDLPATGNQRLIAEGAQPLKLAEIGTFNLPSAGP